MENSKMKRYLLKTQQEYGYESIEGFYSLFLIVRPMGSLQSVSSTGYVMDAPILATGGKVYSIEISTN